MFSLFSGDHADHVPRAVPDLEGALEPDDRRPRLQRPQDLHGDELAPLRRPHRQLQSREIKVSHNVIVIFNFGAHFGSNSAAKQQE